MSRLDPRCLYQVNSPTVLHFGLRRDQLHLPLPDIDDQDVAGITQILKAFRFQLSYTGREQRAIV